MKILCKLILLFLCTFACQANVFKCSQYLGGAAFELAPLSSRVDYQYDNIINMPFQRIKFNVCQYTVQKCKDKNSFANLHQKLDEKYCIHLTSDSLVKNYNVSLINENEARQGIIFDFYGGDYDYNTGKNYAFQLKLQCDKNQDGLFVNSAYYNDKQEKIFVTASSKTACPVAELGKILKLIQKHKFIFVPIFCILGLFYSLFGLRLLNFTLFVSGLALSSALLMLFCLEVVLKREDSEQKTWICLWFSIAVGLIIGYFLTRFKKVGMFAVGAWLGYVLSLILYQAFFYKIQTHPSELGLYVTNIVLSLFAGSLAMWLMEHIVIVATSLSGSYLFVYSLSMLFGKFPDIYRIATSIGRRQDQEIDWETYLYLTGILLMSFLTGYYQWTQNKDRRLEQRNINDPHYQLIHQS